MSVGVLLGGLASVLNPGVLPHVEQEALGSGASAHMATGVRGVVAASLAAGGFGQSNPYARYDFSNSTFDISALARPGAWYAVRVRIRWWRHADFFCHVLRLALRLFVTLFVRSPHSHLQDGANSYDGALNYTYFLNFATTIDPQQVLPGAA